MFLTGICWWSLQRLVLWRIGGERTRMDIWVGGVEVIRGKMKLY